MLHFSMCRTSGCRFGDEGTVCIGCNFGEQFSEKCLSLAAHCAVQIGNITSTLPSDWLCAKHKVMTCTEHCRQICHIRERLIRL